MTGIIFAGSSPQDFGMVTTSTTTGSWFDADYTRRAIYVPSTGLAFEMNHDLDDESQEVWFHYLHVNTSATLGAQRPAPVIFRAEDSLGNPVGRVYCSLTPSNGSASVSAQSYGDTTVKGDDYLFSAGTRHIDVCVKVEDETITTSFWVNGSLMSQAEATKTGGAPGIQSVFFGGPSAGIGNRGSAAASEVICTDGIPTLGWRLAQRVPGAAGDFSEMQGTWADLANEDPGAAVVGNAAGQRLSWTPTAYTGAASPAAIVAVIGRMTSSRMAGTPTKVNQFLRLDGSNYHAPAKSTNIRKLDQDVWWVNPATGLPWVTADFAGMEVGIRVTD